MKETANRDHCYTCFRPRSSCLCSSVERVQTQSCFVILMHNKEFRKTKNGTGRMTHLSLPHSHLFVGIDFTRHRQLNALLSDPGYSPFLLYPGHDGVNLSKEPLPLKEGTLPLFILIDSTWACSKKMIRLSENLHPLPRVTFDTTHPSIFTIKEQPDLHCLSTIETTQKILELLNGQKVETLQRDTLETLLRPFRTMIGYQIEAAKASGVRYRPLADATMNTSVARTEV